MAKLTILSNGMSSADFHTAINFNFSFLNALIANAATLTTITNAMHGQTLLDTLNANFTELNAHASIPVSLTTIEAGIKGSVLNDLFYSLYQTLGRGMDGKGYFLEYYYSAVHFCTTRGNKILAFDGVDTVSLSLDNGVTFPYSKQIVGMEDMIVYAYIYLDGKIGFCTETKAYYSHDNLATVNESSVWAYDGSAFVPEAHDNFNPIGLGEYHPDDIAYWHSYSVAESVGIANCWYSDDGFVNVRSFYKSGIFSPAEDHIHAANYCSIDGSIWIQTGDGVDKCRWIKVTNPFSASRVITLFKEGGNDSQFKTGGMIFKGDYVYWFNDGGTLDSVLQGCWKCLYANLANEAEYEQVYVGTYDLWGCGGCADEMIANNNVEGGLYPLISIDGANFTKHLLANEVPLVNVGFQASLTPKNTNGYYRADLYVDGETFKTMYKGAILMLKVNH